MSVLLEKNTRKYMKRKICGDEEFERLCDMLMNGQSVESLNNVILDNEFYAKFGMSAEDILCQLIDNPT